MATAEDNIDNQIQLFKTTAEENNANRVQLLEKILEQAKRIQSLKAEGVDKDAVITFLKAEWVEKDAVIAFLKAEVVEKDAALKSFNFLRDVGLSAPTGQPPTSSVPTPVCWHHCKPDGCKQGASCRFLHDDVEPQRKKPKFVLKEGPNVDWPGR